MEAMYIHISNKLEGIRFGRVRPSGRIVDLSELKTVDLWRAVFAEFLAQMLFLFLGCSSAFAISVANPAPEVYLLKISLAFGLAIMALIQMIGHVSGGHINPAVTIAMAVAMNISFVRALLYVAAQVAGAAVGGYVVKVLTPPRFHDNLAVTKLGSGVTQVQGFGVELLLTFCLMTVILGTTDPNRSGFGSPALLIGLTVTLGHLAGISYTGSSMNPSRSLGSALASNSWDNHWIYWVGPITGAVLSAIIYKAIINPYRGVINMDEAIHRLNNDDTVVVIPKSYFKGDKNSSKTSETTQM